MPCSHAFVRGKLIVPVTVTDVPPDDTESIKLTPSTHIFTDSLCVMLIVCSPAAVGCSAALYRTEYLQAR